MSDAIQRNGDVVAITKYVVGGSELTPAEFDAFMAWTQAKTGLSNEDMEACVKADLTSIPESDVKEWRLSIASDRTAIHESAVSEIGGMILDKYLDEGQRNFAIGAKTFGHAVWQRTGFPNYTAGDFDALCSRIRDNVRLHVSINPKSIRIAEWVQCHVLRSEAAKVLGDDAANRLSHHEYARLIGRALEFNKSEVSGTVRAGWIDLIKDVAITRETGGRVTSDEFATKIDDNVKRLAALAKAGTDPVTLAARAASEAVKSKAKAVSKANEDITTAVSDALAEKHLSPSGIMTILETVAKSHGTSVNKWDAITKADLDALSSALFQSGRHDLLTYLHSRVGKMLAAVEAASAKALATQAAESVSQAA